MQSAAVRVVIATLAVGVGLVAMHDDPRLPVVEGGAASYLALLGTLAGVLIGHVGVRRGASAAGASAVTAGLVLPMLSGVVGHVWAVRAVVNALRHVSPTVVEAIAAAGFRESLGPLELGMLGTAATALALALGLLAESPPRMLGGLASLALALVGSGAAAGLARYATAVSTFGNDSLPVISARILGAADEAEWLRLILGGLLGFAVVALAASPFARAEDRPAPDLVTLGALALFALLAGGALEWSSRRIAAIGGTSFLAHLDAFDALRLPDRPRAEAGLVLTPDGAFDEGRPVPMTRDALLAVLRTRGRSDPTAPMAAAAAVDARTPSHAFALLLDACRAAGVRDLELHGVAPLGEGDEGRDRVDLRVERTFARAVLPLLGATTVPLARPEPTGLDARDERLDVRARPASESSGAAGGTRPRRAVQLRLADDATPASLVATLAAVRARGDVPFVVADFLPDVPIPDPVGVAGRRLPPDGDAPAAPEPPDSFREALRLALRERTGKMRRCYERALALNPTLAGRASLEITIEPGGRPSRIAVVTDDLPRAVSACLDAVLRESPLPDPVSGPVSIRYPVVFSSGDSN